MLPFWRRFRLVVTVAFALIGAALLLLAWSLIGRFPGSTVVILAMIAAILPPALYGLATVTGWQRSMASGAAPPRLSRWIISHNLAPVLPLVFMFFLLGLGREMDLTPLDRHADLPRSFQESCIAGARQEIVRRGGDPDDAALNAKAVAYCGCLIKQVQRDYTPEEFVRLASNPRELDTEKRMSRIIDRCAGAASD